MKNNTFEIQIVETKSFEVNPFCIFRACSCGGKHNIAAWRLFGDDDEALWGHITSGIRERNIKKKTTSVSLHNINIECSDAHAPYIHKGPKQICPNKISPLTQLLNCVPFNHNCVHLLQIYKSVSVWRTVCL